MILKLLILLVLYYFITVNIRYNCHIHINTVLYGNGLKMLIHCYQNFGGGYWFHGGGGKFLDEGVQNPS